MNFTDFHKDLSKEFGFSTRTSKKIISFLLSQIRHRLLFGTEITLRNIGTFKLKVRHPREFLNLQSNKKQISKRVFVLKFRVTRKMASDLKKKVVYGYDQSQKQI